MATEQLLQCRPGCLVLLLLLLASVMMCPLVWSSPPTTVGRPPELTLLAGAAEKGAANTNLLGVLFIRISTPMMDYQLDFYNWNKVFVRYCDGASFSGDAEYEDQDGNRLFFRGLRIWEAIIDELMEKGLANAKQALLAGCSSGGLATLLHCDDFSARFPRKVAVKCFSDAGFFLDKKNIDGERFFRSVYNGVVHLQNVSKVLPKDCLAKMEPLDCFFPSELIKSINTPTFILNSGYDSWQIQNVLVPDESSPENSWLTCKANIRDCDSTQIEVLHGWCIFSLASGFRKTMVGDLKVVQDKEEWGLFIDSCFTHCQTPFKISWDSPISPRLGNKTISQAVGDWHFSRGQRVKEIDCEYPCNPTCSSQLPS
uniref:Pectin acetylesterase n=1 Tax=Aegilops tauschii TaxID=37682 RepID=M8B4E1_AEGTA